MKVNLSVVNGRYLEDILSQPEALRSTWRSLQSNSGLEDIERLRDNRKFQRVILTGMGSSYFSLHPLSLELAEHGWTPLLIETSELVHYYTHLLGPATLLVVVSQSGQSVETLRLLERNGSKSIMITVTNTKDSELAKTADVAVLTDAGEEFSVSCKTYVAALMALSMIGAALCKRDATQRLSALERAADAVEEYLQGWVEHVLYFGEALEDIRHMFLVGRGQSLASAGMGALITKEAAHFHAEGMSSAAFRHGPFEMLTPEVFVGVFAGDEKTSNLNKRLLSDIQEHQGISALFSCESSLAACRLPTTAEVVRPMTEILPIQMITLALAAISHREPGTFQRATKVTVIE